MSGKSGRRKQVARSKRKKGRPSPVTLVAPQPTTAPAREATAPHKASSQAVSMPASRAMPIPLQHPHVVAELRRIGFIAGIIVLILVVLTQVLS